ncbi:FAD-dependent oxidoreductase [Rhizobium sp. CFBP 8762]|uniref:NAD(P)/FAD-dependent oxidoreductase n=1 Tax=Rhizobium sp. CFBP 8762 TaxID=2775279 RepID=UPI001782F9D1|nr:FAD-dependent oxidoreductase [Rhizobium sp. CFBP 8762]MBD8556177.1 FAD-dependent oxidoreductase [Rhizobium sp. CFBP 8762]
MRRIVILGGGFAGLHTFKAVARGLRQQMSAGLIDIKLISRDDYHTYHGWAGEVLSGQLDIDATLSPLYPMLRESFVLGEVVKVDLEAAIVETQTAQGRNSLPFDHLVIATGSRDPLDRVPGAAEHAFRVKYTRDLQATRRRVDELIKPQSVVVLGGGLAGVESASALAERYGPGVVSIVAGSRYPLSCLANEFPQLVTHAHEILHRQGVSILPEVYATRVDKDQVVLSDGRIVLSDMTVFTVGITFDRIDGTEHLPGNAAGQLSVDAWQRVEGYTNVWAAGDIALARHPGGKGFCPIDALWAMRQGDLLGGNIVRSLKARRLRAFSFKGMGQAAGMGRRESISQLYGLQFTGQVAWLLRIGFFAWYMPYRSHGLRVLAHLLGIGKSPRCKDIRLLAPPIGKDIADGVPMG